MPGMKEQQEISVLGRLCSLEALVLIMGVVTTIYGLVTGNWAKAATGALVAAGAVALFQISRKWCRGIKEEKRER